MSSESLIGISSADFKSKAIIEFASNKQIEIIGEVARYITNETKSLYPDIEWKEIAGLRNILVHEYFGIDADLIWQILTVDIPELKGKLKKGKS